MAEQITQSQEDISTDNADEMPNDSGFFPPRRPGQSGAEPYQEPIKPSTGATHWDVGDVSFRQRAELPPPIARQQGINQLLDRWESAKTPQEIAEVSNIAAKVWVKFALDKTIDQEDFVPFKALEPMIKNEGVAGEALSLTKGLGENIYNAAKTKINTSLDNIKNNPIAQIPFLTSTVQTVAEPPLQNITNMANAVNGVTRHIKGEYTDAERELLAQAYSLPKAEDRAKADGLWRSGDVPAMLNVMMLASAVKVKMPEIPPKNGVLITPEGWKVAVAENSVVATNNIADTRPVTPSIMANKSLPNSPDEDQGEYSRAARQPGMREKMDEQIKLINMLRNNGGFTKRELGELFQETADDLGVTLDDLRDRQKFLERNSASSLSASQSAKVVNQETTLTADKSIGDHYRDGYRRTQQAIAATKLDPNQTEFFTEMPHTASEATKLTVALQKNLNAYEKAIESLPNGNQKYIPVVDGVPQAGQKLTYGEYGKNLIGELKALTDQSIEAKIETSYAENLANDKKIQETLHKIHDLIKERLTQDLQSTALTTRATQINSGLMANQYQFVSNLSGIVQYNAFTQLEAEEAAQIASKASER